MKPLISVSHERKSDKIEIFVKEVMGISIAAD